MPYIPYVSVKEYRPRFSFTPSLIRYLMEIEGARQVVEVIPLPAGIESVLRKRAKISSAHFSTKIEMNPLSYEQVEAIETTSIGLETRAPKKSATTCEPCNGSTTMPRARE